MKWLSTPACLLTLFASSGLGAQRASCPPATGDPFLACQVNAPTTLRTTSALPSFPQMLTGHDSAFTVRVSMVIDTMGRAELASLAVDSAANTSLRVAMRNALPRLRFEPARRNNRTVRQRYTAEFVFYENALHLPSMPLDAAKRRRVLPDGTEQIIVGRTVRDVAGASTLARGDLIAAVREVIRGVMTSARGTTDTASATVCVAESVVDGLAIDRDLITRVSSARVAVVAQSACPAPHTTPGSPLATTSGAREPYRLTLARVEPWSATEVYFSLSTTSESRSGSTTAQYACGVLRAAQAWTAYCGTTTVQVRLRPHAVPLGR